MSRTDNFETIATFTTHPNHKELFCSKELYLEWAKTYPMLFDKDDLRLAENQAELGYHFCEWLAVVLMYHTRGLYSLVEKYQYKNHKSKQEVLKKLVKREIISFMLKHPGYREPSMLRFV